MKENLKTVVDYSENQKWAAHTVLGELVNILSELADCMLIVGGWVPLLLYPNSDHIGSMDVDILLDQVNIKRTESYLTLKRILLKSGYYPHPKNYFTFVKTITIDGANYDVDVDFLAGKYGGDGGNVSKHVDGVKALPATGGNFAFEFPANEINIEYRRPDGALDVGHVRVISVIPYLVMKTAALGRGKPKDAYDIYHIINHYEGGVRALVEEILPYKEKELIREMALKLNEKFASPDHAGPADIVEFLSINDPEEIKRVRQDAFQKVHYIVSKLI